MDSDKVALRRYEDDLNVGGIGVIILGAWDILKVTIQVLMKIKNDFSLDEFSEGDKTLAVVILIAMIAAFLLFFFIVFKIHLYIGLNASKAARGEPYKKGYYTGAIILLVLSVISMSAYVDEIKDFENIDTTIASFIVDLTTIYILWIVISSTRKIRGLKSLQMQG